MRKARIFRLVVRIFLLTFTVSLSIISALSGLSAINILTNEGNIYVGTDDIDYYLDPSDPDNWYVYVPFNITNDGYFDLNDLQLSLSIDMYYNESHAFSANILTHSTIPCNVPKGTLFEGEINATDFTIPEFNPAIIPYFLADLSLTASYSFNLISFRAVIEDFNITGA